MNSNNTITYLLTIILTCTHIYGTISEFVKLARKLCNHFISELISDIHGQILEQSLYLVNIRQRFISIICHQADTCLVGASCYTDGEMNPRSDCEVCRPHNSTDGWTQKGKVPDYPAK